MAPRRKAYRTRLTADSDENTIVASLPVHLKRRRAPPSPRWNAALAGQKLIAKSSPDGAAAETSGPSGPSGHDDSDGGDRAFYLGKVASARFFCREVLPRLAVDRQLVEQGSLDLMQLPDAAFGPA